MLTGQNIVYFAPEKWDSLWRNRQQLMSLFAGRNKVLFVEPRRHIWQTLAAFRKGELKPRDLWRPAVRQIAENLFIFSYPLWAPVSGNFDQLPQKIRRSSLQNTLRQLHMSQPIVWFSIPRMINLLDEIPSARLRIYHVVDEYSAYSGKTPLALQSTLEEEKKLMAQVDMVIVVSEKLYEAKRPFHANTYLVPNGVNYQAYTAALADPCLPEKLQNIKLPRLGYSGLIGDRLNLAMLKELAEKHPEWSLVFLGEVRVPKQAETWQALLALPNVHYLGLAEISQVPQYLKGFQVGLMPYMQNRESENISPLKLYDYLAAGLPVATVDIPVAREFGQYIHLAPTPQHFGQAVQAALADITPARYEARRNIAAQHTWEARVEQLSALIQARLAAR